MTDDEKKKLLADQMAALVTGTQGGATAGQAMSPTRTPVSTTTAPINTMDQNVQEDPMATLASNIGKALNQPVTQPTAPISPEDQKKLYQLEKTKALDQFYANLGAEDQANNARIAARVVTQEFPRRDVGMFSQGLSKTLKDEGTLTALPSGGYAVTQSAAGRDAEVAARRANYEKNIASTSAGKETQQRSELFGQLPPVEQDITKMNIKRGIGGSGTPTTAEMMALASRPQERLEANYQAKLRRSQTAPGIPRQPSLVPAGRGYAVAPTRGTDAMNNPNVLRAVIANNKYDAAIRQRAQERLRQLQ